MPVAILSGGEVPERLNGPVLKTGGRKSRGFESHPLRQKDLSGFGLFDQWELEDATERAQAPVLRIEHALPPWVAFLVVPLFALANAGGRLDVDIASRVQQPITLGVILGLIIGTQVGVTFGAAVVVRLGFASLPDVVRWRLSTGQRGSEASASL